MATSRRSGSDVSAAPVPFSYAQAAKGISTSVSSQATPSKPSSGTTTPSKESNSVPPTAPRGSVPSWADDAESEDAPTEKQHGSYEVRAPAPVSSKPINASNAITSGVSSPELGSSSTMVKDDDVSSHHASESTSTWENKSQASTSVEKTSEPPQKTSEKVKGKNNNKDNFKPLQEAPIPTVNPWARRAELNAKAAPKPATARPSSTAHASQNGVSQAAAGPAPRKEIRAAGSDSQATKDRNIVLEDKAKAREDDKSDPPRRESRQDGEAEKSRKNPRGKPFEKEAPKPLNAVMPLPPDRDQGSWPTPENAVDEDRKKSQVKGERSEKDRKESTSHQPHGKKEWVTVPYTPTVVFNTPLPNTAGARRGGRGGGRGGAQSGGRPAGAGANGSGPSEKEVLAPSTTPNGEQSRRGRPDAMGARDDTARDKRVGSAGSSPLKEDKTPASGAENGAKAPVMAENEEISRGSILHESTSSSFAGQNNTFPRQYTSNRQNKNRRGEFSAQGERRKDSESVSPTKDLSASFDRRTSAATQTDSPDDIDRRSSTFHDAPNGQSKGTSGDRRNYSSFSGRERGRGGARGGRGYQNGHHQYPSPAPTLQSSSSFPLRSPTTFHPDQGSFFPPPSNGRNYRNGPRSHSVTTDSMYGRMGGYPGAHQQLPPIQTPYTPPMYEYSTYPVSAGPFNPYAVDQPTLLSMVSTQLEYYFSVENLCKDVFLRKHMDSQGFVFLNVIAAFNRIKSLTTDMDSIKLVCWQSSNIEFRVGTDGQDRLRPREGWEKWVMPMSERDPSVQNDGPGELHRPPQPHPNGFDQSPFQYYPGLPAGSQAPVPYPAMNGMPTGVPQAPPISPPEILPNGQLSEGINGFAGSNGHAVETSSKAVSGEPDSFSNEQVETLSVIVRKQDLAQPPNLPPSASRTFSNGSIDSRSGVPDDSEKLNDRHSSTKTNGTVTSQGFESYFQGPPRRTLSPFSPFSVPSTTPVRLYWVKGNDAPVESLPLDSSYESYTLLRSKALEQRLYAPLGSCPYDMDVLYQFWSHFLIRSFNTRMYDEFRHFAFEDSAQRASHVGLTNLIKFYAESLLSSHSEIRDRVARHYVDFVKTESEHQQAAFKQLRLAFRNGALNPQNRKRIDKYLDEDLKAKLE